MGQKSEFFDSLFEFQALRFLKPIYQKYKEQILYLFFGGLAFLINLFTFWLAEKVIPPLWANIIAWIAGVLFAFATNRVLVFKSVVTGAGGIIKELFIFSAGRLITLGLEEVLLWVGIDLIGLGSIPVKIIAQIAVLIGNYIVSKWIVFKK